MSIPVIVRVVGEERPVGLPPVVVRKVAAFLAAGKTGTVELNVKEGRILAYKLTESGRVLDHGERAGHDSE